MKGEVFRGVGLRWVLGMVVCWLGWGTVAAGADGAGVVGMTGERRDQPWKLGSFLADAGLKDHTVFQFAFEAASTGGGLAKVWVASSDGLHGYDGYTWRRYGVREGLPSHFVRAVTVTSSGELWVGTDAGAGVYEPGNGMFMRHGSEAGLAGQNVRRIVEAGGGLWFCSDSWPRGGVAGGLTEYRDGRWRRYGKADGLVSDYVMDYYRSGGGREFAVVLGGVMEREGDVWRPSIMTEGAAVMEWAAGSVVEAGDTGLVCSNGREVHIADGLGWRRHMPGIPHPHGLLGTRDGRLLAVGMVADRRGAVVEWRSNDWQQVSAEFSVPDDFVMHVAEDPDGGIWVGGHDLLVRWRRVGGQWSEFPRLQDPQVMDAEGAIWFAHRRVWNRAEANPVRFDDGQWAPEMEIADGLAVAGDGAVWGWRSNRVARWVAGDITLFLPEETGLALNRMLSVDGEGAVWLWGDDAAGVPVVAGYGGDGGWSARVLGDWRGKRVWDFAEPGMEGVWVMADSGPLTDGELRHLGRGAMGSVPVPRRLIDLFGTKVHVDRRGWIWLFGGAGLARWEVGRSEAWEEVGGLPGRQVVDCVERGDEVWFAYTGRTGGRDGIARYSGGEWTMYPTDVMGQLVVAHDGTILWPSEGRFFWMADERDGQPTAVELPVGSAVRRVLKDREGTYWVSAGTGVFRFRPDGVAPDTRVAGPEKVMLGEPLELTARGVGRFAPVRDRSDYLFSWRVDGGEWTRAGAERGRVVATEGMRPGVHVVEVRCVDAGGDVDGTPAELRFEVLPLPVQRRAWFLPLVGGVFALLAGLTVTTVRARERLAGHARELEVKVRERTADLMRDEAQLRVAERAARDGRERFSKLFQASPAMALVTTFPEGRCLDANRYFLETLGYEGKEVLGRMVSELRIWVHPEQHAQMVEDIGNGRAVRNRECQFRSKHDRVHVVLVSVERMELGGQEALLHLAADVTERVRMERRRAMETVVARVLAEADSLEQAIPAVLRAICGAGGWRVGELWEVEESGDRLRRAAVWREDDVRLAVFDGVSAGAMFRRGEGLPGMVWEASSVVFLPDIMRDPRFRRAREAASAGLCVALGFPIRAGGRVTGVLALLSDRALSPGLDFEEELAAVGGQIGQFIARSRARNELERFVTMSPAVLYVLRVGGGGLEPVWVSSTLTAMTGYGVGEFLVQDWWVRNVHPDDRVRVKEARAVPGEMVQQVLEYRFRKADGAYIWIRDERRLVRDTEGNASEVVGTWSDVSERVALEARLAQAQKMEAIGLLSGGIAHDFNNLLGAILGNAQLARMDVTAEHPAAESLEAIVQATQRAKGVVRQILDFARQEARELRRMGLGPVVRESVALLRATLPAEVELRLTVAEGLPEVQADPTQIQQAVLNLGTNAWHALDKKPGRVDLEVSVADLDAGVAGQHPDLRVGRYVRLRVQDTGKGMSRETMGRIFDPFFTTKEPGTGTGLGLSVVHGIVKAHGGAILVSSAPGQGATFDLYFPAAEDAVASGRGDGRREAPKGGNERILLVDDKELIVRSCGRALSRLGYQVRTFTDATAALADLHENAAEYDLVITDLSMPGISGLDIAKLVQQIRSDLPVVLSSGLVSDEVQRDLAAAGVHEVLRKPFTFEELGETVARALSRRGHEFQTP